MIEYLRQLKEDPLVYYIYQTDLSIYYIPQENKQYTVVVGEGFTNIQNINKNSTFKFYPIETWFKMVLNNDLLPWTCACLNRKFILKEHVKLLLKVDPLQLRKQALYLPDYSTIKNLDDFKLLLFNNLSKVILVNQILENHKIVNFGELQRDYYKIVDCDNLNSAIEVYNRLVIPAQKLTHAMTDDLYKQSFINKINKEKEKSI